MISKEFKDTRTGEIVTQVPIMEMEYFEEVKRKATAKATPFVLWDTKKKEVYTHLIKIIATGEVVSRWGGETEEELNKENPNLIKMDFIKAYKLMDEENERRHIKAWVEINEEKYFELLEVLPPQKWDRKIGFFQMSEYMTDNITLHVAQIKDRFFCANRRDNVDYSILKEEIKKQFKI